MTEEFLSFVWLYRLYNPESLIVEGEKVIVVYPGEMNRNSGPDFFNAKLKIGDTIWAGNIEIHIKASDWYRHGHHTNSAFDNVILHVTIQNDQPVYTSKGRDVATLTLDFNEAYFENYKTLLGTQHGIACSTYLSAIDPILKASSICKLGIERLEYRASQITGNLDKTINDWEEAFYRQMARSYGFHVNSYPFEALAQSLPYIIVKKHSYNLEELEALFFGQAGFLYDDYSSDNYYNKLKKSYQFFKAKYTLQTLDSHLWKFMRLRPSNFPTIRIAQFAALIHRNSSFFADILETGNFNQLYEKLSVDVSEYWQSHYLFGSQSVSISKPMGEESVKVIVINTIVPFYFIYGKKLGLMQFQDMALKLLEEIGAENNSVIKQWIEVGFVPKNAFDSQSLLHLKNEYCTKKRCLDCGIGVKIIRGL